MSDPTPHLRSPRLSGRAAALPPTVQLSVGVTEPLASNGWSNYAPPNNNHESSAMYNGLPSDSADPKQAVMLSYGYAAAPEHNPDTDGAFDMDE